MSGSLEDRITEAITKHSWCDCETRQGRGGWNPQHAAAAVVEALGLTEEQAYRYTHKESGRSSILEDYFTDVERARHFIARSDTHTLEAVSRWVSPWEAS